MASREDKYSRQVLPSHLLHISRILYNLFDAQHLFGHSACGGEASKGDLDGGPFKATYLLFMETLDHVQSKSRSNRKAKKTCASFTMSFKLMRADDV